jgi:hypothetical protein
MSPNVTSQLTDTVSVRLHLAIIRSTLFPSDVTHSLHVSHLQRTPPPNSTNTQLQSQFYANHHMLWAIFTLCTRLKPLMFFLLRIHVSYHCKVWMQSSNSFLPWFLVDAFVVFQVFVATLAAKCATCRPPEVTLVSIHWACQLCLSYTATSFRTISKKYVSSFNVLCGHSKDQLLCMEWPSTSALWIKIWACWDVLLCHWVSSSWQFKQNAMSSSLRSNSPRRLLDPEDEVPFQELLTQRHSVTSRNTRL